jgi:phage-related tail fiber protein
MATIIDGSTGSSIAGNSTAVGDFSVGGNLAVTGNQTVTGNLTVTGTLFGGVPSGAVFWFAASTAPTGYLKANGASLSTTTYAALFAVIGYTFGGSGGNFNLPDLRAEFIRGWDDGRGVDSGRVFGSAQAAAFASHTHTAGVSTAAAAPGGTSVSVRGVESTGVATSSAGGTETRPRNIALLPCIKT